MWARVASQASTMVLSYKLAHGACEGIWELCLPPFAFSPGSREPTTVIQSSAP